MVYLHIAQPRRDRKGLNYDLGLVKTIREVTGLGLLGAIGLSHAAEETLIAVQAHIDDGDAAQRLREVGPHVQSDVCRISPADADRWGRSGR